MALNSRFKIAWLIFNDTPTLMQYYSEEFSTEMTALDFLKNNEKISKNQTRIIVDFGEVWNANPASVNCNGKPIYLESESKFIDLRM